MPKSEQNLPSAPRLTRRDFLIALGAGAASAVAGYFLLRGDRPVVAPPTNASASSANPRLHPDVVFGRDASMVTLRHGSGKDEVICGVNDVGAEIVKALDGRRAIAEIGDSVAGTLSARADDAFRAKIAFFVAQLGMLGFLRDPFYAQIVYQETEA